MDPGVIVCPPPPLPEERKREIETDRKLHIPERERERERVGWGNSIDLLGTKDWKTYRKVCCEKNYPLSLSRADIG